MSVEDSDYSLVSQEEEVEEVLKETCPSQYQSVTEEDVSCESVMVDVLTLGCVGDRLG